MRQLIFNYIEKFFNKKKGIDILYNRMSYKIYGYTITMEMIYILILVIYISIVSVYTPRSWLSLINHGYIKFAIMLYILYILLVDKEIILGVFMLVALLVTINIDNSINAAKVTYKEESMIRETFNNKEEESEDMVNDEEDEEEFDNMMSDKTKKDVFATLHQSIHELQKMVDKKGNMNNK